MKTRLKKTEAFSVRQTFKSNTSASDYSDSIFQTANWVKVCSVIALTAIIASGCSQQNEEYESEQSSAETEYVATEQAIEEIADQGADISDTNNEDSPKLQVQNLSNDSEQTLNSQAADIKIAGKTLLINAAADFKVEDVVESSSAIESLTYQQKGYVASSHISNRERDNRGFVQGDNNIVLTTYYRQAEMTVRIPRQNVNKFLKQVQQQVAFLNEQEFSAQDVTLDIYREQLASKLNSDMAKDLSQERLDSKNDKDQTSNVDTITATYAARQQQEYAQLEQMNIADRVKYSTINLTFTQPDISYKETTQNIDLLIEAERPSFSTQVGQAFKEGWEMLREVAITLIRLWWLAVLVGVFYMVYRLIKTLYRTFRRSTRRMNHAKLNAKRRSDIKAKGNSHTDDRHSND
ncbi:DUF4349 domain-containing protein [Psychrobacter sp. W2-37-MNA-CIBAN-0211]|uniref:DUF4349 domain-containing protein n=1 Tax=Psychrobacter sp. W2-37-MNA-CIBAN-0211 TaxID=3140443 RepID=UPI003325BC85